jgi:hypothetical protein
VASLASLPLNSFSLEEDIRGTWLGRFRFTSAEGPADGDRVTLVMGSRSMVGTVLNSGPHGGVMTARVVGGAGGWRQAPTGLSFQNDANLTKLDIAKALASSVGESIESDLTTLGTNWCFDPLASAGANLDMLGEWYMRDDGVTVLGTRPDLEEFVTTAKDFEGMEGRATCLIEEHDAGRFEPGALISAASLENSIRVKHTRYLYSPKEFVVEVSSVSQKPNRLGEHAANKARFFGTYLYRIIEQIDDRLQLQAVDGVRGIPDQVLVTKAHGIPGVESTCSPSGEVLVVFANGNPDKPRVLAYLGASSGDTFTAPSFTFTTSAPVPTPEPIALAPAVDDIKAALLGACTAVAATPSTPGIVAAFAALATALGAVTRTGSIVLEAQ